MRLFPRRNGRRKWPPASWASKARLALVRALFTPPIRPSTPVSSFYNARLYASVCGVPKSSRSIQLRLRIPRKDNVVHHCLGAVLYAWAANCPCKTLTAVCNPTVSHSTQQCLPSHMFSVAQQYINPPSPDVAATTAALQPHLHSPDNPPAASAPYYTSIARPTLTNCASQLYAHNIPRYSYSSRQRFLALPPSACLKRKVDQAMRQERAEALTHIQHE